MSAKATIPRWDAQLQQLASSLSRQHATPLVLITGGKGGVGKSTVAANLASSLARRGLRVLLVDLDLGLANLHVLMRMPAERTLEDHLQRGLRLEDCVLRGPAGLHLLAAGSGNAELAHSDPSRRTRLLLGLRALSHSYDLVLADSAAGIGPDVLAFARAADRVLVVTSPDPAAAADAYGLLKALDQLGRDAECEVPTPELVVNLACDARDAETTAARLRSVCERFLARSPRLAGWLPRCERVRRACAEQRLFALEGSDAQGSLSLACLYRLGERVARLAPGSAPALVGS